MMNTTYRLILLTAIVIFSHSCKQDSIHGHDHDEVKVFITAYNESFEVFAEADPFAVGKTSQVLVHITRLSNFKPLEKGKVTFCVITGNKGVRQISENPVKPGIYVFNIQPEEAGQSKILIEIEADGITHKLEYNNIVVYNDDHTAIHEAEAQMPDFPGAISFTKEQSWAVNFSTALADYRSLGTVIKAVGEVLPARTDEITVSALTHGIVSFANNNLYEGVNLSHGQLLFTVSGAGMAEGNAAQKFQEARNNYEKAEADFERLSSLAENGIVSERELLQAKNNFDNAKLIFNNLAGNYSEKGQVIKSPFNGYLAEILVSNGEFVEPGQVLAIIAQNKEMVIKVEVQQRYAPLLKSMTTANVRSQNDEIFTLEELGGHIISYARNAKAQNHMIPVFLKINNPANWMPGTLLDVYLKSESKKSSVIVPSISLIEEQGNFFVFVQIYPESFEKRLVAIGNSDGVYTEILSGLLENERVVTKGAIIVKMAAASGNLDPHSGHVH